jgi:nucleotide-binding universal stress UspA family protein
MFEDVPEQMPKRSITSIRARQALRSAFDAAKIAGVPSKAVEVEHCHPYEAIVAPAQQEGYDPIVMASHGRRGTAALLLGSEITKVLT